MNKKKREKQLQIVVFVLIAIITLGIGYTAISSIILTITGHARADVDEANFKVHFDRNVEPTMTVNMGSATIDQDNDKVAHISVTGLKKAGDSATAEYTIINESNGIGAKLSIDLVNTNTEHFKVTETLDDVELQAGDTTKVRILVELLETPTDTALETDITGTIEAKAIKNSEANSNDSTSKTKPGTFAGDSWATIAENVRNNDTSAYKVGDTKTVKINGTDYTVRIANKSTPEECNNENFSQTACGFVVEFTNIVTMKAMYNQYSSPTRYPESDVYYYLNNTLYEQLPTDLKSSIKTTKVVSGYACINSNYSWSTKVCNSPDNNGENFVTTDRLYLLSGKELSLDSSRDASASLTKQLDYYQDTSNSKKKYYNNDNQPWTLRSADICYDNAFQTIYGNGDINPSNNTGVYGISPAFRIG